MPCARARSPRISTTTLRPPGADRNLAAVRVVLRGSSVPWRRSNANGALETAPRDGRARVKTVRIAGEIPLEHNLDPCPSAPARHYETSKLCDTGHLVLATLHTIDAGQTVNRVVGMFEPEEQDQVRVRLADTLRWVIEHRTSGAQPRDLHPLIEFVNDQRAVTEYGLECLDEAYSLRWEQIDDLHSVYEKVWVDDRKLGLGQAVARSVRAHEQERQRRTGIGEREGVDGRRHVVTADAQPR